MASEKSTTLAILFSRFLKPFKFLSRIYLFWAETLKEQKPIEHMRTFLTDIILRSSFYRSSNSILNVLKKPSEPVFMRLLFSICVPNITYACEVANYHHKAKESLHVALNDAIRRIFSYNRWESIRTLRESMGYLSVTEIFGHRKLSFDRKLTQMGNSFLSSLSQLN